MTSRNDYPLFQLEAYDKAKFDDGYNLDIIECELSNGLMIKLHRRLQGFEPQVDVYGRMNKNESYVRIHQEKKIGNQIKELWGKLIEMRMAFVEQDVFVKRRTYKVMIAEMGES